MKTEKRIIPTQEYLDSVCELIRSGADVSVPVTGGSMAPYLIDGRDFVILRAPSAPPKKGDILLYRRTGGRYVLHRVCRIKNGDLTMIGDAQRQREPGVKVGQVCAAAVAVIRRGKREGPRSFWWNFFSRVWIRMIPFRPVMLRLYEKIVRPMRRKKK